MPEIRYLKPKNSKFMRYIRRSLCVIYSIVTVGGFAICGIGIWTMATDYGGQRLSGMIGAHLFLVDSYLLIVTGVGMLLITLCGCCGIIFYYKCLLGLHIGIMAFLSMSLVAGGCLGFVFRNELEDSLWRRLEINVKTKYGREGFEDLTLSWDSAQRGLKCCGAHGDVNSTTSWHLYKQSAWYHKARDEKETNQHSKFCRKAYIVAETSHVEINSCVMTLEEVEISCRKQRKRGKFKDISEICVNDRSHVPLSCCRVHYLDNCDTGEISPSLKPPLSDTVSYNITFYTLGCYDRMVAALVANGIVIGVITIFVAMTIVVQIIIALCFYRNI